MAIGTPVSLGSNVVTTTGSTVAITITAAVSAGDFVICGGGASASGALVSASDSRGNTYQLDKASAVLRGAGMASSKIGTALQINDTITLTFTSSVSGKREAWAVSVSGLDTTTWADKTNAASGTTAGWSASTGTLTQADEIVFASGFHATGSTSTPATNYTELYDTGDAGSNLSAVYRIVSATTAESPGGTWSSSGSQFEMVCVTYKGAASGSIQSISGATAISFSESASIVRTRVVAPTVNASFAESASVVRTRVLSATTNTTFAVSAVLTGSSAVIRRVGGSFFTLLRLMRRGPFAK